MASKTKSTAGPNDRPKDETIAQTGDELPDDLSNPIEADEDTIERTCLRFEENAREKRKRNVEEEIDSSQRGAE